ncbi:helix-turn-helix transcriptional regulator [Brumicola blandensis]|uniref:AlpA family phage regulatory protein n=1 Tax=Brumicola blandensis TaxID=3075611 RepID=A0AAW8R011_9ALTE|nr:AlpA family phage regulatory protein [Alteromonas sp. W409]MDT0581440.1 AlpA family phage regulatory protein [Alteromonas sp. W409]
MQFLSVKSIAHRYDIAISTVWLRVKEGKIPKPIKLHGTSTRWKLEDLEKWESKESQKAEL